MFEVTFEIPTLWLVIGISMVYITATLSKNLEYWPFQQKYLRKNENQTLEKLIMFPSLLIVQSFLFVKRKVPNVHDRKSESDDEAFSLLLI